MLFKRNNWLPTFQSRSFEQFTRACVLCICMRLYVRFWAVYMFACIVHLHAFECTFFEQFKRACVLCIRMCTFLSSLKVRVYCEFAWVWVDVRLLTATKSIFSTSLNSILCSPTKSLIFVRQKMGKSTTTATTMKKKKKQKIVATHFNRTEHMFFMLLTSVGGRCSARRRR